MKRLLLAVAITGLLFAALNVSGGATPTASAACQGPQACGGGSCSWAGPVPPGGEAYPCYGYWTSGWLSTAGCCSATGSSYTGFVLGYNDTRWGDVSNLHIYARYPAQQESFVIRNHSGVWVWYSIQVQ